MIIVRVSALGAAAFILSAGSGFAGPCTTAIDRMQAQLDASLDVTAGAGPVAPESTGALLHREPTPDSIAGAEQKLGEGRPLEVALAALGRAREADRAGDKRACEQALGDAQQAIKP